MAKKIVQDVLPPESKSIRNIPLPKRSTSKQEPTTSPSPTITNTTPPLPVDTLDSRRSRKEAQLGEEGVRGRVPPQSFDTSPVKNGRSSRKTFWVLLVLALLIIGFSISFLFVSAHVEVIPKSERSNLNTTIVAKKDPQAGELGYNIITLSKEAGKVVDAQGEEQVETKASGKITIFNEYSQNTQRLIANTRFQTPSGLIYRIAEAVTVPGYTKNGTQTIPGSITVTVYADKAGDSYNIGLTDFTIPGFEGDPRFETIYARSQTVMEGGFVGTVKKVTPEILSLTQSAIRSELESELVREVSLQIPETYIVYPGTLSVTFESLPQTNTTDVSAQINERGTITAVVLDKQALDTLLVSKGFIEGDSDKAYVSNIADLSVEIPQKESITANTVADVSLVVTGGATFVWKVDSEKMKQDLAGTAKKNLGSVLSSYEAVDRATVMLSPFWKRSFPKNPEKILVSVQGVD